MLIDELQANRLTKAQQIELIAYCLELSDLKKADLVTIFLDHINGKEFWQKKIFRNFPGSFAVCPSRLEKMLGITPSERIRWTKVQKLPVVPNKSDLHLIYPTYDYYETLKIIQKNKVEQWRLRDKQEKNKKSNVLPKVTSEPSKPIHTINSIDFFKDYKIDPYDDYDHYEDSDYYEDSDCNDHYSEI